MNFCLLRHIYSLVILPTLLLCSISFAHLYCELRQTPQQMIWPTLWIPSQQFLDQVSSDSCRQPRLRSISKYRNTTWFERRHKGSDIPQGQGHATTAWANYRGSLSPNTLRQLSPWEEARAPEGSKPTTSGGALTLFTRGLRSSKLEKF